MAYPRGIDHQRLEKSAFNTRTVSHDIPYVALRCGKTFWIP